jgi:hypothetical protein
MEEENKMDFGYVIKRAWQIIWKFKVLWVFGILASCGQASSTGGSNWSWSFSNREVNFNYQVQNFFNQLTPTSIALLIGLAILFSLVVIVIVILLGTIGRVGLIRGTVKAEQGAERLTFGELWRDGLAYFWRVFGLNLLIGIAIFVAIMFMIFGGILLTVGTLGLFALCLLPLMCLLIPVMWAVYVIIEQANVALVVENTDIIEAIKRGWQVVWRNIGSMIVMSLILILGVGLVGGIVIGLPLIIVAAPSIAGFAVGSAVAIRNGLIVSGLFFIVYLPFLLILSGILRGYTSSAWTLTYLRLTHKTAQSQLGVPKIPEITEAPPAQSA